MRQLHVAFLLTVCERVTLDGTRAAVQQLLRDAGASDGAIKSVIVAAVPTKGGAA